MQKFNYKTASTLGLGFFGISAVWAAYNSFVPVILRNFALSNAVIGLIMTIDNILAVTVQPAIGALSDRTNTSIGRRKPFIIVGAPAAAVCFALIPFIHDLYLLVAVILLMNLGMAVFRSPVIALMPDTFEPAHRGRANGVINLMGGLGALIVFLMIGRIFDMNKRLAFIVVSLVMLSALLILFYSIREKSIPVFEAEEKSDRHLEKSSMAALIFAALTFSLLYYSGFFGQYLKKVFDNKLQGSLIISIIVFAFIVYKVISGEIEKRVLKFFLAIFFWFFGYNAIETFFTLFCIEEIGISPGKGTVLLGMFSLAFIIAAVPSSMLSAKIGRRKVISRGLLALIVISILISMSTSFILIGLFMLVGGVAWAAININAYPVVCDAASLGKLGRYTGYYYFFSMLAQTVSPPVNGILVDISGSYKIVFISAAFFFAVAILLLKFFPDKNDFV